MSVEEQTHGGKISESTAVETDNEFGRKLAKISLVWVTAALFGGFGLVMFSDVFAGLAA